MEFLILDFEGHSIGDPLKLKKHLKDLEINNLACPYVPDPTLLDEKGHWYQLREGQPSKSSIINGPTISTHRLSFMHRS